MGRQQPVAVRGLIAINASNNDPNLDCLADGHPPQRDALATATLEASKRPQLDHLAAGGIILRPNLDFNGNRSGHRGGLMTAPDLPQAGPTLKACLCIVSNPHRLLLPPLLQPLLPPLLRD